MARLVYLLGPAGCGKSTLAGALLDLLSGHELRCFALNLDPGAEWLPYTPEVDVRTRISLQEVMRRYKLGPNGALVVSTDLMVNHLPELRELIEGRKPDYVVVDTPGQMELFAFRETGARVIKGLGGEALIVFLIDSLFARRASDFASALMLATSVQARFALPQLNVLTKSDLAEPGLLERVERWTSDLDSLAQELRFEAQELQRQASQELLNAVRNLGFVGEICPVSALRGEGMVELYSALQRAFGTEAELDLGRELNSLQ